MTFSVDSIANQASFEITLEDIELDTGGVGSATGSRTFEYVADENASVQSAAQAIFNQIEDYFNTETGDADNNGTADYSVTFDAATNSITINNASGTAASFTSVETDDGTPGSAAGSTGLGALNDIDVSSSTGASDALANIDGLIQTSIDAAAAFGSAQTRIETCLLYTSPSPRDQRGSRMPSSA